VSRTRTALAVATLVLSTLACSSSSSGGGDSKDAGVPSVDCLSAAFAAGCFSCLQSKCSSQLAAIQTSCGDFIACACPGGTYSASAYSSSACTNDANEPSCATAGNAVVSCDMSDCAGPCGNGTSDGG
jgi:hypothetical protein